MRGPIIWTHIWRTVFFPQVLPMRDCLRLHINGIHWFPCRREQPMFDVVIWTKCRLFWEQVPLHSKWSSCKCNTAQDLLALPDAPPRVVCFSAGAGPLLSRAPGGALAGPQLQATGARQKLHACARDKQTTHSHQSAISGRFQKGLYILKLQWKMEFLSSKRNQCCCIPAGFHARLCAIDGSINCPLFCHWKPNFCWW